MPEIAPKVLIEDLFNLKDPLLIQRKFISEEDLQYIASYTNANTHNALTKRVRERTLGALRKVRRQKKVITTEIRGYFRALFLLGT